MLNAVRREAFPTFRHKFLTLTLEYIIRDTRSSRASDINHLFKHNSKMYLNCKRNLLKERVMREEKITRRLVKIE